MRGKLLLPDFEVKKVDESDLPGLKAEFIRALTALANYSCDLVGNNETKATNLYADLISIIYKLPTVLSYAPAFPLKPSSNTGLPTPFEYFFTYVIVRHLDVDIDYNNIEGLLKTLDSQKREKIDEVIKFTSTLGNLYEKLLYTPADTRPGFNFTSLVSHLQLTSILVWLLQPSSLDLNYLRIAALLHDLGKLFNPTNHVTASVEILDQVIEGSGCLKGTLSRVRELVEKHHSNEYIGIVEKADMLASATDRLSDIVNKVLESEDVAGINKCKDVCYSLSAKTKECMECLEKLGEQSYERASQILYKSILESFGLEIEQLDEVIEVWKSTPSKKVEVTKREAVGESLGYLVYIDFPGVQRFITSFPKLRDMSFASFLVDFITSVYPFIVLDQVYYERTKHKSRIPAEALLSGYGGHSYIVVRRDIVENESDPEKKKEEVKRLLMNSSPEYLDIRLDVKVVDLAYENYVKDYKTIRDEIASMGYERYKVDYKEKVYSLGLHRVCDNCGIRPAVKRLEKNGEEEYLCEVCSLVRELSSNRGFMAKLNSTYLIEGESVSPRDDIDINVDKNDLEALGEVAMEIIAGYKTINDTKYVALVKADGNDGGKIFGNTATFSEYIDKSFRLDYGVKKSFYKTLSELLRAEKEVNNGSSNNFKDLTSRTLAGVLYLGGDDIMLMMPSVIAVPFAVKMFESVNKETGFTFKVGVISVKPDHPVQFAYKAVNELMESSKLKKKSSLSCLVFSSTLATEGVIEAELEKYKGKQDSKHNKDTGSKENKQEQDSYLVVSNDIENVKELLQKVKLWPEPEGSMFKEENVFKELVEIYYKGDKKRIRDIIRPLEDLTNYADTHKFYDTLAYILRYRARSKRSEEEDKRNKGFSDYDLVSFLLSSRLKEKDKEEKEEGEKPIKIPLYDYYFILKSIRVGV